jgi:hypothetical protein
VFKFIGLMLLGGMLATWAQEGGAQAPAQRIEGMPYEIARSRLMSEGWRPEVRPGSFREMGRCGPGNREICRVYPEAESCAGTGWAPCTFYWRSPNGQPFALETSGESIGYLKARWLGPRR